MTPRRWGAKAGPERRRVTKNHPPRFYYLWSQGSLIAACPLFPPSLLKDSNRSGFALARNADHGIGSGGLWSRVLTIISFHQCSFALNVHNSMRTP